MMRRKAEFAKMPSTSRSVFTEYFEKFQIFIDYDWIIFLCTPSPNFGRLRVINCPTSKEEVFTL